MTTKPKIMLFSGSVTECHSHAKGIHGDEINWDPRKCAYVIRTWKMTPNGKKAYSRGKILQ